MTKAKINLNEYTIINGYDYFKNKPLYKVISKNVANDYVGEWHLNLKDAKAELLSLKKNIVKKSTKKKVGALPVFFIGTFYDISFKIINQFDIYNNVNAIVEDKKNGNVITTITGNQNSLINTDMFLNYAKRNSEYSVKEWDSIKTKINKFFELIKKEVKSYNAGKTKTIKKQTIKILAPTKKVEKIIVKNVRQTGSSNTKYDKLKQALPVGKRKSASGKTYYEYRKDHSDAGVLLGVKKIMSYKDEIKKYVIKLDQCVIEINRVENDIIDLKNMIKTSKSLIQKKDDIKLLNNFKKYLIELKKHKTELKKLI